MIAATESELLSSGLDTLGLDYSDTQKSQLESYVELILKWNKIYNLTAIRTLREAITHHLLDSLAAVPVLKTHMKSGQTTCLDVGSGAGLPGLVFAIMQPSLQVTTLDAVQKKVAFMQQAIASLGLKNAQAMHARIEDYQKDDGFDLITSRAFSTIEHFVNCSRHLLSPDGKFLALKGKLETDQYLPEGWKIESTHALNVPFLPEERNLFVITR